MTAIPAPSRPRLLADLLPGAANIAVSWLLALVWGLPAFILIVVGTVTAPIFGAGLLVLIPVLALLRVILNGERSRARNVYGLEVRDLPELHRGDGLGPFLRSFFSPQFWRSLLHHMLKLFLGGIAFFVTVPTLGAGLAAILQIGSDAEVFRFLPGLSAPIAVTPLWGALLVATALAVLVLAILSDRLLDASLLSTPEAMAEEVSELSDARDSAERAAAAERQRIERDLHDGAQPRLVNLAMTLGMAKAKLDSDPETARRMIEEAHGEAKLAVNDLRQLARGIHPAVLTDRGLDAALSALAARSPIPVRVRLDVPQRPSAAIESVACFVVAEALTNAAKHSQATRVDVVVTGDGSTLRIIVFDDGTGGATITRDGSHTGLAGLEQRVRSARGHMTLTSPDGGPTVLTVEIPCA